MFQSRQFFLVIRGQFAQYQVLSGIFQNNKILYAQFVKNTIGQTVKTDHVNIHDGMIFLPGYQLFLSLHGKLFRNDNIKHPLRLFPGVF